MLWIAGEASRRNYLDRSGRTDQALALWRSGALALWRSGALALIIASGEFRIVNNLSPVSVEAATKRDFNLAGRRYSIEMEMQPSLPRNRVIGEAKATGKLGVFASHLTPPSIYSFAPSPALTLRPARKPSRLNCPAMFASPQ